MFQSIENNYKNHELSTQQNERQYVVEINLE